MPNSFQFIDKTTGKAEKFAVIDDKLCAFLGVEPHPVNYYREWYDRFGELAALGKSFADMRKFYEEHDDDDELLEMLDWLDEHYRTNAWYMPR